MAVFLENIPAGFANGCEAVNELSSDLILQMCHHAIHASEQNYNAKDTRFYSNTFLTRNENENRRIQMATNTVLYIFRTAKLTKPTAEDFLKKLKSICLLDEEPIKLFTKVWTEQLPSIGKTKTDDLLSIGKRIRVIIRTLTVKDESTKHSLIWELLDMQWKVGLATSSSDCRNLNKPFVTLMLKIQQSSGTTTCHTVEMTIPEFKDFSTQMKNMSNILETS